MPFITHIEWTIGRVLFNYLSENPSEVQNFILLLAKCYMYKCRCAKRMHSIHEFESEVLNFRSVEKYNAIKTGKMQKHVKKGVQPGPENENLDLNNFLECYMQNL